MIANTSPTKDVAILGRGRLGRALAIALGSAEVAVRVLHGRDSAASPPPPEDFRGLDLLVLAVPDDAIGFVATALAPSFPAGSRTVVLHLAGAVSSEVLEPFSRRGLPCGSCHPLQTFPETAPAGAFQGVTFGIEGESEAQETARWLVEQLGGRAIAITASTKPLYHLAAVLAANGSVALLGAARDALLACGFPPEEAVGALAPLVRTAIGAALERGPESALTGPVARGDRATLERHRSALRRWDAPRQALYEALVREQERLVARRAVKTSLLPPARGANIL